ncbi:MAG TPA: hypothetical protein VGZ90_00500 [Puia sp.]|jgi:hypothetical protein|nr:hypothetical protein [Puia sp.]
MKKYITCTLISITISYIIHAQENVHPDIIQISKPFTDLNQGSFKGKNLLFEGNWVKGRLLTSNNSIVSSDSFFFNFDKIEHRLLITSDFKKMFEIDRREFKAALFYSNDSAYVYKHIYFINDKDLFQVLVFDENRYSLYKVIHTKLIKESFTINMISTPGSSYFREKYVDMPEYYIFFPNREYRSIFTLKKGPIERIFELNQDSEKVNEYLRMGSSKVYNEDELIQLILYLNKESI